MSSQPLLSPILGGISACLSTSNLPNFAANIGHLIDSATTSVFKPLIYLTRRLACLAVLLLPLASGCALWNWNKADWTLENYRDPRAVDIDHRLDKPGTAVQNPF